MLKNLTCERSILHLLSITIISVNNTIKKPSYTGLFRQTKGYGRKP